MARTRLAPELRREQLLDLGAELFAAEPYERVHIERVAEIAGVSRGLLYHYFPTKGAFFAALVERTVENLRAATAPDLALSPLDQLRHGIDAYLAPLSRQLPRCPCGAPERSQCRPRRGRDHRARQSRPGRADPRRTGAAATPPSVAGHRRACLAPVPAYRVAGMDRQARSAAR